MTSDQRCQNCLIYGTSTKPALLRVLESVLQPLGVQGGGFSVNASTAAFLRLESMVHQAKATHPPRTVEEEDLMALEDMILREEGPDFLARYLMRWAAGVR